MKHTVPMYPMIEMGWSLKGCVEFLQGKLTDDVPKSSCVFCPYRTNQSCLNLKTIDHEGWNRVVHVDEALRANGSIVPRVYRQKLYLHRNCEPLVQIDFGSLAPNTLNR